MGINGIEVSKTESVHCRLKMHQALISFIEWTLCHILSLVTSVLLEQQLYSPLSYRKWTQNEQYGISAYKTKSTHSKDAEVTSSFFEYNIVPHPHPC
jgi:hypothetical protein